MRASEYSTRSGGPEMTVRSTIPRASSSFIRSESRRSESSGTAAGDLGEAERTVHQDAENRASPSASHELDGLVVEGQQPGAGVVPSEVSSRGHIAQPGTLRCLQGARHLAGPVDGNFSRDVDHRGKALERYGCDRLQNLLVVPARLAGLLMEVHCRAALLSRAWR